MNSALAIVTALTVALLAACVSAGGPGLEELRRRFEETRVERGIDIEPAGGASPDLGGPVSLDEVVALARSRNPELREALAKAEAAAEAAVRAGTLDDPSFQYRAERLREGPENMFGLMQMFPWPEKLSLRAREALRMAEAAFERYREMDLAVTAEARAAYYMYALALKESEIFAERAKLLDEISKVAEARYAAGSGSQSDVLKPQVEMVMVHTEMRSAEQRAVTQKAMLNKLMSRSGPLGKPAPLEAVARDFDLEALVAQAVERRPELATAGLEMLSAEASRDLAEVEASAPDFTVGFDYVQMPTEPDDYQPSLGVTLPWGNPRHDAEIREREMSLRGAQNARVAVRDRVVFEVRDAFAKVEAARKTVAIFTGELLPRSRQSAEAARAAYEADRATLLDVIDADRSRVEAEMGYWRAVADYQTAAAELDRAVGGLE